MQDAAVAAAQQPSASAATTRSVTSTKTSTGLLAKLNFITGRSSADCCPSPRTMDDHEPDRGHEPDHEDEQDDAPASTSGSRAFTTAIHQHRTRRRRGSLRKVALLGRGAQRDKKDSSPLTVDTSTAPISSEDWSTDATPRANHQTQHGHYDALGLKHVDLTPQDHRRKDPSRPAFSSPAPTTNLNEVLGSEQDAPMLYHSTTDEEDGLQLPSRPGTLPLSSGSESYFPSVPSAQRRPSFQQTKSPLSYNGLSPTPLQPSDAQVDYAETEWWGWIILIVTWLVFVVGMGSCLGVWSWAWDVGKTPYAPPELEDDPTLPIVGYYPALIILTAVMAWVWVVVAWVGMKYFRHAKISGD